MRKPVVGSSQTSLLSLTSCSEAWLCVHDNSSNYTIWSDCASDWSAHLLFAYGIWRRGCMQGKQLSFLLFKAAAEIVTHSEILLLLLLLLFLDLTSRSTAMVMWKRSVNLTTLPDRRIEPATGCIPGGGASDRASWPDLENSSCCCVGVLRPFETFQVISGAVSFTCPHCSCASLQDSSQVLSAHAFATLLGSAERRKKP